MDEIWDSLINFSSFPRPDWDCHKTNQCRAMIEVPGGINWKIRKLGEDRPECCWKYVDSKLIAYYYFNKAEKLIQNKTTDNEQITNIPLFYATLPYFTSPYQISIQPRFLNKIREKLHDNLIKYYSQTVDAFAEDEIFETVPCALIEDGKWFRGKIISISKGKTSALILFVDFGVEKLASLTDVRPLAARFARIPPLALKCRVKDVFVDELDTGKVNYFKQLIASLNNTVRVEICTNEEPYFVNLFHPTIANDNIGSYFYRPVDYAAQAAAKHQRWVEHKRKQQEDDSDSSEEIEEEEEEDEEVTATFIKSFGRSPKFPRRVSTNLDVVHVENSTLIYLRSDWMREELEKVENALQEEWSSFPAFPEEQLLPGRAFACSFEDKIYRAICERNVADLVEVFLLDYGKYILISKSHLRALPFSEPFTLEPLLYAVSLERNFNYFPHPSESKFLKEMMPCGSSINFYAIKTRNRIPVLGRLSDSEGDIGLRLEKKLISQRVDVFSREIVLYKSRITGRIDTSFTHRFTCPSTLVKGNLSECTIVDL